MHLVRVTVGHDEVVKQAHSPDERNRLALEARVLDALDHPCVVGLVRYDPVAATLTTRPAPGRPLASAGLSPPAVARVAASAASTLDELHRRDCVHGAITAEHVLADGYGAVLCSFGRATSTTEGDAAADVRGLGHSVLVAIGAAGDPTNLLRPVATGRRRRPEGLDAVAAVARRLTSGDITVPAEAAAAFAEVAGPTVPLVAPAARGRRARTRRSDARSTRRSVPAAVALAAVPAGFGFLVVRGADAHGPLPEPSRNAPPPATAPPTAGAAAAQVWPPDSQPAVFADGVLTTAGGRFSLGTTGDHVAVADLDCDGTATPVHLVRESGAIAIYDRWPDGDEAVPGRVVATLPAAEELLVRSGGACHRLWVRMADGTVEEVPTA